MAKLMQLALPVMVIFGVYYLFTKIVPAGGALFEKTGDGKLAFMTGVGMAWSTFVVSGTMTGDIVRYTKTGKQAVWVTAVAFIFSNAPIKILGALIAAAIPDPSVQYFFDQKTVAVLLPLLVLAILSNWSTCDRSVRHSPSNSLCPDSVVSCNCSAKYVSRMPSLRST